MSMQQKPTDHRTEADKQANGLSVDEALAFHEGWAAARKGEPFDVGRGRMWVDGWISYGWAKGAPSGARH